jgi:hypothetical protein
LKLDPKKVGLGIRRRRLTRRAKAAMTAIEARLSDLGNLPALLNRSTRVLAILYGVPIALWGT